MRLKDCSSLVIFFFLYYVVKYFKILISKTPLCPSSRRQRCWLCYSWVLMLLILLTAFALWQKNVQTRTFSVIYLCVPTPSKILASPSLSPSNKLQSWEKVVFNMRQWRWREGWHWIWQQCCLHTEVRTCWSVHWENRILVGTIDFVELLQGGSMCFCAGVGRTSFLWEAWAHAGTGVIMHPS